MSRRRALAVIGGAIAAVIAPGSARPAVRRSVVRTGKGTACVKPLIQCQNDPYFCRSPGSFCCPTDPNNTCVEGEVCCGGGRNCCDPKRGEFCCNYDDPTHPGCCVKGQICDNGACVTTCPPGKVKCGKFCCKHGEKCKNGSCCAGYPGGVCCDALTEDPCLDKKECCKKGLEYCCAVGATKGNYGTTKSVCCPLPGACLPESGDQGGIEKSSQFMCCPPERQVGLPGHPQFCCPAGTLSLAGTSGKFILPAASGVQNPFCCPEAQTCGDNCCAATSTCCGDYCTSLLVDTNNCGKCGNVCKFVETCNQGRCVPK